jgi:hypothetical protein
MLTIHYNEPCLRTIRNPCIRRVRREILILNASPRRRTQFGCFCQFFPKNENRSLDGILHLQSSSVLQLEQNTHLHSVSQVDRRRHGDRGYVCDIREIWDICERMHIGENSERSEFGLILNAGYEGGLYQALSVSRSLFQPR